MSEKPRNRPVKRAGAGKRPSLAERADIHDLYQRSVQSPEADCEFFAATFEALRGRPPRRLREDFCGTGYMATTWCKGHPKRSAVGVDLDAATLEWGRARNVAPAGPEVASRVTLLHGDVREVSTALADMTCAMNFSFCVFKTRAELRAYFEAVRRGLRADGVFLAEIYGGTEAIDVLEEEREVGPHTYVWEQERYDPIDHSTTCHISFTMSDGSKIERAFTYEWRLWSLPELRELLLEAGFREVKIFWEEVGPDEDDEEMLRGTGTYVELRSLDENQESWLAYVIALA